MLHINLSLRIYCMNGEKKPLIKNLILIRAGIGHLPSYADTGFATF